MTSLPGDAGTAAASPLTVHDAETFHAMLNTLSDGIYAIDMAGRATFVNKAAERLLGWPAADLLGRNVHEAIHYQHPDGSHNPASACPIARAFDAGSEWAEGEEVFIHRDGSFIPVHYRVARLIRNGRIVGSLVSFRDITAQLHDKKALRHARDEALKASRLKSEFLANMSHEIRTPMNGVIGMTDLLLETELSPEQKDFATVAKESAQSLLAIINDILDFSKIEAGRVVIESIDYSPTHLVESVVELLAAKAREKGLSIMAFVDPALPKRLMGDPTRLRQILVNLIGNAVKFTNHGEVAVRVGPDADGATIRYEVRDTGIGIAPEFQSILFNSFTQADSSITRQYGGTGLGLAISRGLVELMGGRISLVSAPGQGSTFAFVLPLEAAELENTRLPEIDLGNIRLMVADDQPLSREAVQGYCRAWGMDATGLADGAEALVRLGEASREGRPYDLLIAEMFLPGLDGISLAKAVRADPVLAGMRLILISDREYRQVSQLAAKAGFDAALAKPVRQSVLLEAMVSAFDNKVEPVAKATPKVAQPLDVFQADRNNHKLVLLVEPDPTNQKVAQLLLRKLGYACHIVDSGQAALDAVAATTYSAVLMDCRMPVMDGFETTRALRRLEQMNTRPRLPVIALTADAMEGVRELCLESGMDDYISKPVRHDKLVDVLDRWVR
jgi:PAS domain S-box-containing protein